LASSFGTSWLLAAQPVQVTSLRDVRMVFELCEHHSPRCRSRLVLSAPCLPRCNQPDLQASCSFAIHDKASNMNKAYLLLAAAALALSACGGQGDDATGDIVAKDAEAAAETLEAQSDAAEEAGNEVASDRMEDQADAVSEAGEEAEEKIDDADIETSNPAGTAAAIEQASGMPTSAETAEEAAKGQ
jgi:hypothetical protein